MADSVDMVVKRQSLMDHVHCLAEMWAGLTAVSPDGSLARDRDADAESRDNNN